MSTNRTPDTNTASTNTAVDFPPQPLPDVDTEGFWQATHDGQLAICHCQNCGRWMHPPLERCARCAGATRFDPVSGNGTVYSFIVANRASVPGFAALVPYLVAVIELDEQPGLRLVARIVGTEVHELRIGQRVACEIVDLPGGDFRIPQFRVVA